MRNKELKHMMQGAAILTLASFIAKLLSAVYRVPFQNLVGDEGFYVYQQVYPIYGIAMTLALSGLPIFLSKLVVEEKDESRALQAIFPYVFWLSLGLWAGTLLGSGWLARLMGDVELVPLIRVVSFTFLLVPGLSLYRGKFQGRLWMTPTAVTQVVEQLLRVGIILLAAFLFTRWSLTVYQVGTLAMSGALFGGCAALVLLWRYDQLGTKASRTVLTSTWIRPQADRRLLKRFVYEGGLISLYSALLILFQLIDSFVVKNALTLGGMAEQVAKISKGVYDRGQPLVQLGLVVATALSATFLPSLTKHFAANNLRQFEQAAKIYLRFTTTIASAAAIGLAVLLPYVNFTLFDDTKGTLTLGVYVLSIAFMAILQTYQSIDQSRNRYRPALTAALVGVVVKLGCTAVLTLRFGTLGASIGTIAGLSACLLILARRLPKTINAFVYENHFIQKLSGCLAGMVGALMLYRVVVESFDVFASRTSTLLVSLGGVGVGILVFVVLLFRLKLFTIREWLTLPFGAKILRMKRGTHEIR